jgi:hypothetical protein
VGCLCCNKERLGQTPLSLVTSTSSVISFEALISVNQQFIIQSLPSGLTASVTPAVCLTALYTSPVLLSTAPSLYSAHNQYQTNNLCPVVTLLTPTTQQYICHTSSLFNSTVHFTSSTVNCTFTVLST